MAASRKTKQELITEFRSSEILAAARKVFAEKGFSDATVDEIAESAGIAKGTVYLYFASKRDIYFAALRQGIEDVASVIRKKVESAPNLQAKIRAYVETKLRHIDQNLDFFRIYHAEFGTCTHPATLDPDLRALYVHQIEFLAQVVREGIASGEARELSADSTAWAISEMTRGVALRRLMGWSQAPVDEEIEELIRLVWNGIQRA